MLTQVLGIGSSVRTDDSVGLYVVEKLRELDPGPGVILTTGGTGGIALLDLIRDCDRLIIVDAIMSGQEPGEISRLSLDDLETFTPFNMATTHGMGLVEVLNLRKSLMDRPLPETVEIWAIEAEDAVTLSEKCTPKVQAAGDRIAAELMELFSREK